MTKIINALLDATIFALAAIGALMAFGVDAAWALARAALSRANPIVVAAPSARRARSGLGFIFEHSGLPQLCASIKDSLARRLSERDK